MRTRLASLVLVVGLALTALLATAPSATAHPVHCGMGGSGGVNLWVGAYVDQLDPSDPETFQSGIIYQDIACCQQQGWVGRCAFYQPELP